MRSRFSGFTAFVASASVVFTGLTAGAGAAAGEGGFDPQPVNTHSGVLERAVADVVAPAPAPGASALDDDAPVPQVKEWARLLLDTGDTIAVDPESPALAEAEQGDRLRVTVDARVRGNSTPQKVRTAQIIKRAATNPANLNHRAYIVVVNDPGEKTNHSVATARAVAQQSIDYWKTESLGAISSFEISAVRAREVSGSCSYRDPFELWKNVAAEYPQVDFGVNTGNHLVVFTPAKCNDIQEYAGVATVGTGLASGGLVTVSIPTLHIAAHEFGHNFSLGHANIQYQTSKQIVTDDYLGGFGPQAIAIGDYGPGALDVGYQDVLGIAPATALRTVSLGSSPKVVLNHAGASPSLLRGLTFTDPGTGERYYVEYRSGAGRDAETFYASGNDTIFYPDVLYQPGVRVYSIDNGLDTYTVAPYRNGMFHATVNAKNNPSLTSLNKNFTVKVGNTTATTAEVTVSFNKKTTTKLSVTKSVFGKPGKATVTTKGITTPTGTVTLYDGKKKLKTLTLKKGKASYVLPANLSVGKHSLEARYSGSPILEASSGVKAITVGKGTANAKLIKAAHLKKGKRAKVTVELSGLAKKPATGTIKLKVGSKTVTKAVKLKKKHGKYRATVTTVKLPAGKLKLVYSGDKTYKKATYLLKLSVK